MNIVIKRAYDGVDKADGYRVLVDRLWPRGVKKELLGLDEWDKDVAPSGDLRVWFGHDPAKFDEFRAKYEDELAGGDAPQQLLKRAGDSGTLTLVYAARDPKINHAVILQSYLQKL